ncbi:MAG TPA: hypothetical protein VD862_02045, partial [Candidatus Paceibacterota bacterium]|nr:hypothetical protein [Candidatus Paceibacterota bacterium]
MAENPVSPSVGAVPEGFTSEPLDSGSPKSAPESSPVSPPVKPPPAVPPAPVTPERAPYIPPATSVPPPGMPRRPSSSGRLLRWLIVVAVGLFIVSVASLFWSSPSFRDQDVVLTLEGTDRAVSGEEVTYTLKWQNNTKLELHDMSFRIFYPEGSVVLVDGEPTQPDSEGFEVDSLQPGESGEREITLFLVGDKGSIKTATVNLIFEAGSLRSAFEKEVRVSTAITDLPVTVTLTAPPTSVSGQPVTYIVDIRNETEEDFSDLRLVVTYPEGFTVRDVSPQPDGSVNTWPVPELASGAGKRYSIQGVLAGVEREAKTVTAVLKRQVGGEYIDFVRADSVTLLSSPLLSVRMTVNRSRDYTAHAGDTLEYEIQYTNNSRHNLIGLELGVKLEGQMYDFSGVDAEDGFFDQSQDTVRFTSSGVPDLASLPPGKTGAVGFRVPLKSGFPGGGGTQAFFVKATSRLSTPNVPTGVDGNEVFAQDVLTTRISSQPSLQQALEHADGPVPPEAGERTTFTATWEVTNPGNELRETTVRTTLVPGVIFQGGATSTNGASPAFDPNTGQVTWNIGVVPYGVGAGLPKYRASFQFSVTPSVNQQGQIVELLGDSVLAGTDSFTGQVLQSSVQDTNILDVEDLEGDMRV